MDEMAQVVERLAKTVGDLAREVAALAARVDTPPAAEEPAAPPQDLKASSRPKGDGEELPVAAPPTGRGTCYSAPGCGGQEIDHDVTYAECFGMDGRSWKGPNGCVDLPGWMHGGVVVAGVPTDPMTTRTRRRCTWAVVVRRSDPQVVLRTDPLHVDVKSEEFRSEHAQRTELTRIVQGKLSQDVGVEVLGASSQASLSVEQIRQAVDTFLASGTRVLIHYRVTITTTLHVRRDWTVREVWDWTGADCTMQPDPQHVTYTLQGPEVAMPARTEFDLWEVFAPSAGPPQGRAWAEAEARALHDGLLRAGRWVDESRLPLPAGFPLNPNVG